MDRWIEHFAQALRQGIKCRLFLRLHHTVTLDKTSIKCDRVKLTGAKEQRGSQGQGRKQDDAENVHKDLQRTARWMVICDDVWHPIGEDMRSIALTPIVSATNLPAGGAGRQ